MQMLRVLCYVLLFLFFCISSATGIELPQCNCDGNGIWSVDSILWWQKLSDFLIATSYFSIPLELFYFLLLSNIFPFKWIIFQFGAFIILCGLTHLLNVFTYEPHSFLLMMTLTVSKFFTALVSIATAITLLTLIPQLLRIKVRENLLMIKADELVREVGLMKRQEEASWHVRMLTQEIRRSLDRHTILYTTLVELSKTLDLQNCAIWMPNEGKTEMKLTHESRQMSSCQLPSTSIPIDDAGVRETIEKEGTKILNPTSLLAQSSCGGSFDPGPVAAIRMPMLRVSNFKGGTPQMIQQWYAILVLVLPRDHGREWSLEELQIVEVVADQVAVALSHAAILEESQLMRDKLAEQNRALLKSRGNIMMASKARNLFQSVITQGMRRPMHSISGLLSMLQQESFGTDHKLIVNSMAKTSKVIITLIDDILESPAVSNESPTLEMMPFRLHFMIKEAASIAKSLCLSKGFGFDIQVDSGLPACVFGDEKRIVQVLMHIVASLLHGADNGFLIFLVHSEHKMQDKQDQRWMPWKSGISDGNTNVMFEVRIKRSQNKDSISSLQSCKINNSEGAGIDLSFSMCKKLVQMMQGNIWAVPDHEGFADRMILLLRLPLQPLTSGYEFGESIIQNFASCSSHCKGLRILLVDNDGTNRAVTQKILEKLGCHVYSVASGVECLSCLGAGALFDLVILDINMPNMNGYEVAVKIRKCRSGPWPLIVALTANTQDDVLERCVQSGMVGVIRKPVMLHEIAEELQKIIKNS